MYKVYRDPEGIQCVEQSHHTQNRSVSTESEDTYKKRIEGLNKEIKVLNNELKMVTNY